MIDLLRQFLDLMLHLDKHLAELIQAYGVWTYVVLFGIVFAETGLVITPFLPGDSLLFAAGTFAGSGSLDFFVLFLTLSVAAIAGDTVNYWVGQYLGDHILRKHTGRFIKKEHLDRTHAFFERYGGKTIIIARFVPIIRTFAPFVAGIGTMTYGRFLMYNVVGGLLWVGLCLGAGYLFGGMKVVQENFSLVILAIIVISLIPAAVEILRHRSSNPTSPAPSPESESLERN